MFEVEASQTEASSAARTFTNCALYLKSEFMGNIERTNCREVAILEGVKYAQYQNAVRVRFTPKRSRKVYELHLTYKPFLMILSAADAVEPDAMLVPEQSQSMGVTVSKSRYMSFDSRWQSDFEAAIAAKGLKPLVAITNDYDTGAR